MKHFLSRVKKSCKDFFTNKSAFSLVELIVVIAIMAVMAAILSPALLGYVERSRAQKDDSAMGEITNAIQLSLADMNVYDEVLQFAVKDNYSCYADGDTSTNTDANKITTKEPDLWLFNDNARLLDETVYKPAGKMRGATVTFKPNGSAEYILKDGIVNRIGDDSTKKGANAGKVLNDCPELYSRLRSTVGDTIKVSSQTYRNSDYTIFISIGTTGGNQADKQDAIQVYGQYNGTNLPEVAAPIASGSQNINASDDPLTNEDLSNYELTYYNLLTSAVDDVNNNEIGANATVNKDSAVVAVYTDENGLINIVLLKDQSSAAINTYVDMTINLNGKKILFTSNVGISAYTGNLTIVGKQSGSYMRTEENNDNSQQTMVRTIQCNSAATLKIDGGTYEAFAYDNDKPTTIFTIGQTEIHNATVNVQHNSNEYNNITKLSYAVYTKSDLIMTNAEVTARTHFITTDKETVVAGMAIYGTATSNIQLNNCNSTGVAGGVYTSGDLRINGGVYKGFAYAGVTVRGGTDIRIENATMSDGTMPSGYSSISQINGVTTPYDPNRTGLYTYKANGGNMYVNNCNISGTRRPFCIHNTTQNLSLYMSNCTINHDSEEGIIIGVYSNSTLYIGKGNNFTPSDTNKESMCQTTNEEY